MSSAFRVRWSDVIVEDRAGIVNCDAFMWASRSATGIRLRTDSDALGRCIAAGGNRLGPNGAKLLALYLPPVDLRVNPAQLAALLPRRLPDRQPSGTLSSHSQPVLCPQQPSR